MSDLIIEHWFDDDLSESAGAPATPAPFDNSGQVFGTQPKHQLGYAFVAQNILITTLAAAVVARGGWMPQ